MSLVIEVFGTLHLHRTWSSALLRWILNPAPCTCLEVFAFRARPWPALLNPLHAKPRSYCSCSGEPFSLPRILRAACAPQSSPTGWAHTSRYLSFTNSCISTLPSPAMSPLGPGTTPDALLHLARQTVHA